MLDTHRISVEDGKDVGNVFKSFLEQSTVFWLHVHELGQVSMDFPSHDTPGECINKCPKMAAMNRTILLIRFISRYISFMKADLRSVQLQGVVSNNEMIFRRSYVQPNWVYIQNSTSSMRHWTAYRIEVVRAKTIVLVQNNRVGCVPTWALLEVPSRLGSSPFLLPAFSILTVRSRERKILY